MNGNDEDFNWSIWLYVYVSIYLKIQEITTAKKADVQAELFTMRGSCPQVLVLK